MRVLLLLCVLQAVLLSGCRKKTAPEFYKLESDQSVLVSRDGDEAWTSAEMSAILAGLQAIPEDAVEKPRAVALAAKIAAERARVEADRVVVPAKPPPVDPFAGRIPSREPAPEPAPVDPGEQAAPALVVDAGPPSQPWPGMDEKSFVTHFGRCFSAGPKATLPDGKPATAYVLSSSADCQKEFGAPNTRLSYLFTDKGLWGKSAETTQVVDAGTITTPGAPPGPPAPPRPEIITIPGAPQPEGYEKTSP